MRVLFILSAVIALASSKSLSYSYTNCTGPNDESTVSSVTWTTPAFNQNVTITGTGTLKKAVSKGMFKVDLSLNGFHLQSYTGDICAPKSFPLPLNGGSLYWLGVKCPLSTGTIVTKAAINQKETVPNGKYTAKLTATDGTTNAEIFCVNIVATVAA